MSGWIAVRDALLVLAVVPLAYYTVATLAALRFFRRDSVAAPDFAPAVSILKPTRGLDREAYENYASFCRQDYPEFEILFCVTDANDPAVPVIERLIRDFPGRSIRLLTGSESRGANDKVNKLCRMAREARYDTLLVSDSDVRVDPNFLRATVAPFQGARVGGVTCLYRGLTDGSLAADLEALGNSTDFASGVLVVHQFGRMDFMLGAVMVTTKKSLSEIGGFESLADYFCDDYELGNRIAARGHRVELSALPVSIVYPHQTLREAFRHHIRWYLSIRASRPWGHAGMILSQGLPWALLAAAIAPSASVALCYIAAYALLRGVMSLVIGAWGMRDPLVWRRLWLLPFRDLFGFFVWLGAFLPQRIRWRDQEFRIREKRLVAVPPAR